MPTRRTVLRQLAVIPPVAALACSTPSLARVLARQAPPAPDEMTRNTSPDQVHFPPPDFGPPPAVLPPETRALAGSASLREHARKAGLIAGAAIMVHALGSDPALAELVAQQYGIVVPENELKWRALRPAPGRFDFTQADELFSFAERHKLLVRGHTLVWHNSVPDWLLNAAPPPDVRTLLTEHIRTVMGRYHGRVQSWDVVNEAVQPSDGEANGLRRSFWYKAIGPDYIELAYRTARETDPKARLVYNDYGVEYDSPEDSSRREAILALLRRMKSSKVPIDAVGIQSHLHAASQYSLGSGLKDYIAAIRDLGFDVYLTEMDVNEDDIQDNDVAVRDRIVAETYAEFLNLALTNPAVKLVLTWGVNDRRTWLNDGPTHHKKQPERPQRSLPFDPQYRPTPAFFAIRNVFDANARRS